MNYEALLIDLDGVLRQWPPTDAWTESEFGLPAGSIRSTAFASDLLLPAISVELAAFLQSAGALPQQAS